MTPTTYPTCVRHLKPRKDVRLRHYFLCDKCSNRWVIEAFEKNEPLYCGERLHGYCQLCNQVKSDVRLRTWFLCDICDRVAASIGRSHIAEEALLGFWHRNVQPRFPDVRLVRNDTASLRPRRDSDDAGTARLDFLALDTQSDKYVFGIEQKTGRSAVRGSGAMSQFQLDTSDCDCILKEMRDLSIPAYVVHAQVLENWMPPTMGFRVVDLWWTDVYLLTTHFKSVRQRRDERRGAAHFGKKAFADIATLPDALWGEAHYSLVEQFRREGVPRLYEPEK